MTTAEDIISTSNEVNQFLALGHQAEAERDQEAQRLAYDIAERLSGDTLCDDISTFLFAVSMGKPELYQREAAMLETAISLGRGAVVGIVDLTPFPSYKASRLSVICVTTDKPLQMTVRSHSSRKLSSEPIKQNHSYSANLRLIDGIDYIEVPTDYNTHPPLGDTQLEKFKSELFAQLLISYSDVDPSDDTKRSNAFDRSKRELVVGADRISQTVLENQDEVGTQMIGRFLDRSLLKIHSS